MSTATQHVPVQVYWAFKDDDRDEVAPQLTVDGEIRETVLAAFDVETIDELVDQELSSYQQRNRKQCRIGIVVDDEQTFHSETDLLASVEGISEELAAGLIDECGDIPSICEGQREDGKVYLGDRLNDAETQGHGWANELRAFCEELGHGGFEQRLKEAGIWVEPQNVTA